MSASRLAKCRSLPCVLSRYSRRRVALRTQTLNGVPPPFSLLVAELSSSPAAGPGARVGRWVKRQVYTVLILGGVSAGALIMV